MIPYVSSQLSGTETLHRHSKHVRDDYKVHERCIIFLLILQKLCFPWPHCQLPRSLKINPGLGNDNLLHYDCLENPIDRGACWATVHGVARVWTQLSSRNEGTHIQFPSTILNLMELLLHWKGKLVSSKCHLVANV